ncbi:MAG: IS66 family transposase [candidate division Zixibacteria bacterium]|nr:IS66 family transposase [candidate division Zixibacteria bacterium]
MRNDTGYSCHTRKYLRQLLIERDAEIERLKSDNLFLEYELKQLRSKWFSNKKKRLDEKSDEPAKKPKKLGAPVGHTGCYRAVPEHVDVIEDVVLDTCPQCGNTDISECSEIEEHVQEDIILPAVKVTKYRKHHFWCGKCKKVISGKGIDEIPNSYIGPQAKAVAAFLKYDIKISNRDIQKLFKELCGLQVVPSSIPGFNNQVRKKCMPLYEELLKEIKKAPYIHADETGCPVNGKNWWDWIFVTSKICLHVIHESRGQKVVEQILGKKYGGILLSDFLSAYNKLDAKAKQRCLVHLLRDLKKILACTPQEDPAYTYCQRLKDILQYAIAASEKYNENNISARQFSKQKKYVHASMGDLQFPAAQKNSIVRIAKRLARHKNELFTFLDYKGLPYHNNYAERMIRPSVLLRKITFGHRSENGIRNHSVLQSILQTGKLNAKEPIPLLKTIITGRNRPSSKMCLGP